MLGTIVGWVSFLSTPSARRATPNWDIIHEALKISIHALREEGDHRRGAGCHNGGAISIHALRRADRYARREISIHALREEGDGLGQGKTSLAPAISIHALREEGDAYWQRWIRKEGLFLSTPSARRATPCHPADDVLQRISIHALREEGDLRG